MRRLNSVISGHENKNKPETRFISVLSGKGGVGKSLLAFNLAERLAASGYRVLVVDTDYSGGNIHILANINCDFGLGQYAAEILSLPEAVTPLSPNLDILPAPDGIGVRLLQSIAELARWIKKLRADSVTYDFVIIDHPSGISDRITLVAHACDLNLLVMIPELTSLADGYGLYKYLLQAHDNVACQLLLNRVVNEDEVNYIQNKFYALTERFLDKVPGYLGCLPESDVFRQAVARQCPVARVEPDSNALQALNRLSQTLAGYFDAAPINITTTSIATINKSLVTADI
ncbi:MAG: P-loop NTPase [candidate division Zixibacteria bacterium]|nr:P-loop NTPase [candidate division Zixibacteria bacterium]MDD5425261.1 P-loop NTPase [candidate division Zixibacteria bacterium]